MRKGTSGSSVGRRTCCASVEKMSLAIELEGFLLQHPAVRQVQVIGVPDAKLVEVPMAFVQLRDGHSCDEREIIEFCSGRLSSFKIPRAVRFVREFPQTASGKIQKYKLRQEA